MKQSINSMFKINEIPEFTSDHHMGLWRNEKERLAIQLTEQKEYLRVIYMTLRGKEKTVQNSLRKTVPGDGSGSAVRDSLKGKRRN